MPITTRLAARLGLTHPIVQAPMAGGGDTADLVAAVGNAGALGFVGAAYLTPEQIRERCRAIRARTTRPFGINLFAPTPRPSPPADASDAIARVAPFYAELGLAAPAAPPLPENRFDAQVLAVIDSGAAVFSFTFGVLPEPTMAALKRSMFVLGTATSVEEAAALERSGVDAVIAQGWEAGGHRGTFLGDFERAAVGTLALVPQIVDAVSIPVIASGGIMDGRGIVAALALGAAAVQMGTAFLTCDEAGIPEAYKQRILEAREDETRLTRAFSGPPARGLPNRVMAHVDADPSSILPFPLQNVLTRPMRTAAAARNDAEYLSLWAGQGPRLARRGRAADLVARLVREADAVLAALATS